MITSCQPLISIITPSFNRGWSIRSCIQSLQSQTFAHYEHIIIDGGSTDETLDILKEAASVDTRIRFISEPDSGMYDAVNKGMRMATAPIVAYLNTDDFYLPRTLEKVFNTFTDHPDLSMLYGHWMSWHPETSFLEILPVFNYTAADMAVFAVLPQPSVFFRRQVFESLDGFDISYKLLADNDFFSKAAIADFKFVRIDDYLSVQTVHSGNLLAGNLSAVLLAKQEGERYRIARREELSSRKVYSLCKLYLLTAYFKKMTLPAAWRVSLVVRLWFGNATSAEHRLDRRLLIGASLSKSTFFRYLFGRGGRHKFAFYKIEQSVLSKYLGILLPDVNALIMADTHKKDRESL